MEYIARMNPPKVIGLVALAEKPGLVEALRIMRRELSRHGLTPALLRRRKCWNRRSAGAACW